MRCLLKSLLLCLLFMGSLAAQEAEKDAASDAKASLPKANAGVLAGAYLPDDTRAVIAGDLLRLQIFEDEEPAVLLQINDQGYVDFPYVGRMQVEGMTCKAIADKLEGMLEQTYYYQATVYLAVEKENPIRGKVYIVGEVGSEGALGLPSDTDFTISKAVLAAGGFSQYAKESKVRIIRDMPDGKQKTFVVDVGHIYETGDRSEDLLLKPGDFIIVPKSSINF